MANLKEVRERISSVISTQQITKAMKMVSAAKLRKAQQAITEMRPYADKLNGMLQNIVSNLEGDAEIEYAQKRDIKKAAVVLITSNRGLCGAFNANISKSALASMATNLPDIKDGKDVTIIPVGKKGFDFLKNKCKGNEFNKEYMDVYDKETFEDVSVLPVKLMEDFKNGEIDAAYISYGRFKNAGVQFAETFQFLPIPKLDEDRSDNKLLKQPQSKADYIFEPNKSDLLKELVPNILQTQFFRYLLDTKASEHGARMTAMDKATENANELLKELRINYNKARQEAITNEISEIVGGAAALEGA